MQTDKHRSRGIPTKQPSKQAQTRKKAGTQAGKIYRQTGRYTGKSDRQRQ